MKILKPVWILSLVLFCAPLLRAQWVVDFYETTQHLDSVCGGTGHPLADGTEIRVYHDWNSNGPDTADTLLRVCDDPPECSAGPIRSVNYNTFWINGANSPGCTPYFPGGFHTLCPPLEMAVFCVADTPAPNRIWLGVCFDSAGVGRHYASEILSPQGGGAYSEFEINNWTCLNIPCPEPTLPYPPDNFRASDSTYCDSVRLSWRFSQGVPAGVDSVFFWRGTTPVGAALASVTDTVFWDRTVPDAAQYTYYAKSRRITDSQFSSPAQDLGAKHPSPPPVTMITATDDSCNVVRVSWTYGTNEGVDSFIIRRNGARVGALLRRTTAGPMSFLHVTTDSMRGGYQVCGWNAVCGEANCSVVDSGLAAQPPAAAPTGIVASFGLCNVTSISWDPVGDATAYRVYRYSAGCEGSVLLIGTVAAPPFNDNTAPLGTTYGYKVRATNSCGDGPASGCANGYRVGPPVTPSGVAASDSTSCDTVTITWSNVNQEAGFWVYRTPGAGGATDSFGVPPDTLRYFDVSAVPGTMYNYQVSSFNACGISARSIANVGARRSAPPQVQNTQASDSTQCWGVQITWNDVTNEDSFVVKRGGSRIGAKGANVTSYNDSTAVAGVTYSYTVFAKNRCGSGTESAANAGSRRSRPGQATGLSATDTRCDSIRLTWNTLANTDSFRIIRNGVYLTRVAGTITAYNDRPDPGTYGYRILPVNACGLGDTSVVDSGARLAPPPPAVSSITASDALCGGVQLTWANVAGETGFRIRRNESIIDSVLADVLTYTDNSVTFGTRYRYEVVPYNDCGFLSPTVHDSGTGHATPVQVANVLAEDSSECWGVRITWGNIVDEDSFIVKRDDLRIGATAANDTAYNDSTAERGTIYSYTVLAKNVCGEGPISTADGGSRKRLPGQVTGLEAGDTRCDSVLLSWDALANTDSFRILRDDEVIASVGSEITSYEDRPLPGTHAYQILPWNECGNGDTSEVDSGTRMAPPPVVDSVTAGDSNCDGVLIEWTDVAGEDNFVVRRDGDSLVILPADTLTYFDSSAAAGVRYLYEVLAYNVCGAADPTASDSGGRRAVPEALPSLGASTDNCDWVLVRWGAVANVDTYFVYRNLTQIAAVVPPDTFYADTTAVPGQNYNYVAQPWNACGFGTGGEVGGLRLVFPSVPQNLSATQNLCGWIRLTWDAPVDTAEDVDSYLLIRDGTDSLTVSGDSTAYNDEASYGEHTYVIQAVSDECGATEASAEATGERLVPAGVPDSVWATNTRCDSVIITWLAASGDVDGYIIYSNLDSLATVEPDTLRYADVPPTDSVRNYKVRAFSNECGYGNMSAGVNGYRLQYPTTVTGLTATVNRCDSVRLDWNVAGGTFNGYIVRRDSVFLDTVNVRYYVDAPDVGSWEYDIITYSVYCEDSDPTDPVTGTRLPDPLSPDTVEATTDLCDSVVVTWNAASGTFDGYNVYRNDILRATLPDSVQRYAEAPTSGVTYVYSVTAWDSVCGEAAVRDTAHGMRQADAGVPENLTAVGTCDAVDLTWNTATGAVAEYRLYRNDTLLVTVFPPDTTYSDTSAERGVTYTYEVSAFSTGCGETAPSSPADGARLRLPVQVTGLTASEDNCAGIFIEWAEVAGTEWYRVYRGDALIDSVSGGLRTTSYLDTNVVPRSTHSYQVNSVNICGEGARSDSAAGTRYDVPDSVTGFSASDTSCAAVYLVWEDVATDTGYVIYRDGSPIDTIGANSTAYVDTVAAPGAHGYVVKALNECGLSAASDTANGLRIPGVAQVTGVSATSGLCDSIVVTWTDLTNEDGYYVYRGVECVDTLVASDTSFTDLVEPGSYEYQISGYNVCGESELSAAVTGFRATVPPQVTTLSATQDSCTSVTITWEDVATEQFYRVFRGVELIDTVDSNVTVYVDDSLAPGPYVYAIQPGNYCGNGPLSAEVNGRVADVPAQVVGVTASTTDCDTIFVRWNDLADELYYRVFMDGAYQDSVADTAWWVIPSIGLHTFAVQGVNRCGVGDTSVWVTGERQGPPVQAPVVAVPDSACDTVRFCWTAVDDITGYRLYRNDTLFATVGAGDSCHADPSQGGGQFVRYTVRGYNECGDGPMSNVDSVYFVPLPAQVTGVTADTMSCLTVTVTWNNVASETGYRVFRNSVVVGTVAADTLRFVDTAAVGTHYYKVQAFNECGSGVASDSVQGRRRGAPATTSVTASDTSCTQIVVSWTNVDDELGYYVFENNLPRDTVGADTLSVILTPEPGAYAYTVQPFNDCGLANMSAADSGHRLTIPPRVTGVAATRNRCDSVIVTWPDVPGETRYVIFRDDDSLNTVGADTLRYADAPVVGEHEYKVRADNQCGNGILSDSVMGERLIFPLAPVDVAASDSLCGQIRVIWLSGGGDVDSFKVYRNDTLVVTVAANVFTHIEGAIGTHAYRVVAHSIECGDGPGSLPDSGTGHDTAGVPTGVTFIAPEICDTVRLQWTASTGEVEKYMIYRDGALLDSSLTASYRDGSVPDGHNHAYRVSAKNAFCGESAQSDPPTAGRVAWLMNLITDLGDTLKCDSAYRVEVGFCLPLDSLVFYLSVRGGPFDVRLGSIIPDTSLDTAEVNVPLADSTMVSNCRILAIGYRGARVDSLLTDPLTVRCPEASTEENLSEIPKDFFLDQNYPNPFNPATNIRFGVPRAAHVTIEIFDILGRKMTTLINDRMQPGIHTATWDCSGCPSGMYIVRMHTGERVLLRKMLLMK